MAEVYKISTSKYIKQGKVDVDGHIWSVKLPGAGTELRFSQASREAKLYGARINVLDKKIDAGTITESELDKYEEYNAKYNQNEKVILDVFMNTFRDDTKDNAEVRQWMEETPTSFIIMAFEELKRAGENQSDAGATEQPTEQPAEAPQS